MKVLQDLPLISNRNGSDESTDPDSSQPLTTALICATTSSNCVTMQSFSNIGAIYKQHKDPTAAPAGRAPNTDSEQPKFEMDFNQGSGASNKLHKDTMAAPAGRAPNADSEQPKFEMDFNQGSDSAKAAAPPQLQFECPAGAGPVTTTRDDAESSEEAAAAAAMKAGLDTSVESSESCGREDCNEDEDVEEIRAELEGESRRLPEPPPRILSHPAGRKPPPQDMVFGKLSVMVSEVTEDAMVLPLRSKALGDLLERCHTYRAIALRCGCELIYTRRVVVKRMVKWIRYAVLLLRGPSEAALRRFRSQLEVANAAFRLAVPYNVEKPRPRLLTSEQLPDNLELAVCQERTGRATTVWERLPLEMSQRKLGKPLYGKPKSLILPNNAPIGTALAHTYPAWGFQDSKPIPHTYTFETAVVKAEQLEKQQEAELQLRRALGGRGGGGGGARG